MSLAHFSEMLRFDTLFKITLLCQNTLIVKEAKIILTASVSHRNKKKINKSHESVLLYILFMSGKQKSHISKNFLIYTFDKYLEYIIYPKYLYRKNYV